MNKGEEAPKIFISYSWKPKSNKQKVLELAERLVTDGVRVVLDEWDFKEGHDKYQFMESMVNDSEIKRVLLICNKEYTEKANKKSGGVGIESMIVSDEIYSQVDQIKFIPVVFEFESPNNPFLPTFIKSRKYIDLSTEEVFESGYEVLLRNIFEKPAKVRPPLGKPPSYITTDEAGFLQTSHKVNTIRKALIEEKKNAITFIQDYYDTYIDSLVDYKIKQNDIKEIDYDELVLKAIHSFIPLRDDFVHFLEVYASYSPEWDLERLFRFFERKLEWFLNLDEQRYSANTVASISIDPIRFYFYESILYFTATLVKKEKFKELGHILHNLYMIDNRNIFRTEPYDFYAFKQTIASLNSYRKQRMQLNRISITADKIKERATSKYSFEELQQADALLYYTSLIQKAKGNLYRSRYWFPETSAFEIHHLFLFKKASSSRFFIKLLPLLGVDSKEDLVKTLDLVSKNNEDRLDRMDYRIASIIEVLDIDEIGKYP